MAKWSPAIIRGILDTYALAKPNCTEAVLAELKSNALVEDSPSGVRLTQKGTAFVEMICDTPLPIAKLVDPRTNTVVKA